MGKAVMASPFASYEAPRDGAPLSLLYPQFIRVPVPAGTGAASAWRGVIQPFDSDSSARAFLQDAEADRTIWVAGGRIKPSHSRARHWANPNLVNMVTECELLVLLPPPPAHPRGYLLSPRFAKHYSWVHPHPRYDQRIDFEGGEISGMCVYSPPEAEFDPAQDPISQFLDQATIYVAKHLIWLRTRQLHQGTPRHGIVVRGLQPGEEPESDAPTLLVTRSGKPTGQVLYWRGYWPGRTAKGFTPGTHLATVNPRQECPCGSGQNYGDCHRSEDQKAVEAKPELLSTPNPPPQSNNP
jgi:SEC-C motif